MKKKLFTLLLLVSAVVFAADVVQYATKSDFHIVSREEQPWFSQEMISLKVKGGSAIYITNYISNYYEVFDIGDTDYIDPGSGKKIGYDLSVGKFGYMTANLDELGNVTSVSQFYQGKGTVKDFSYTASNGKTVTTPGYLLDEFDEDTEIFFVMTPLSTVEGENIGFVDTYNLVNDPSLDVESALLSRQINTVDQNGTVRVNLGVVDSLSPAGLSHEFASASLAKETPAPSGQPLPGVLTSCLVGLAATSLAARRRKQSRK